MKKLTLFFMITLTLNACKFTESPPLALAKEMCSCLFVSNQSEDYCRSVTKEGRILANYTIDYNRKEIWASGGQMRALSKLNNNPRFGCDIVLLELDPESGVPENHGR